MADARSSSELLSRLADLSEGAIQRLSDAPGADKVAGTLNSLRERLDELQKRVRGLEDLEKRLTALEKKVDRLSKSSAPSGAAKRGARTPAVPESGETTPPKSA
jgi:DNA repair exonuclease SbcCD ATPase subunit